MSQVFSKKDLVEGKKLLEQNRVKSLLFSEGTYQVEVAPLEKSQETYWPFLQLSDNGEIKDAFCTCPQAERKNSCAHLAAAYQKVMDERPLHVRFRESLWNQIGLICAQRHGYEPSLFKRSNSHFEAFSQQGKRLLCIHPKNTKTVKQIETLLYSRPVETEETSLKFSNLDQEEIILWREGRPSAHLRYELSFWSDLAKWWFELQEANPSYTITFTKESPPQFLKGHFPNLDIEFYLGSDHWNLLIPALETVNSPLEVHPYHLGKLEAIHFLKDQGVLVLEYEDSAKGPPSLPKNGEGTVVDEWIFFPDKGFYPKERDPLLEKKRIQKEDVDLFFKRHLKLLEKYLSKETIHPHPIPVRYDLIFDQEHTLKVTAYAFEKGDLQQEGAFYFGTWIYLPERGFFQLSGQVFDTLSLEISKNNVSDFVNRYRVWLQGFEGFQTHVSGVESHLGFRVDTQGKLTFFTRHEFTEETEHIVDLGEWIYVQGKGFYAKVSARAGAFIKPGVEVEPYEVSAFIYEHHAELEAITGFFSPTCPLVKSGLNIGFSHEGRIHINPEFFFAKQYVPEKVRIFGDYTYVENEGFSLIPHGSRLPENYKVEKTIDPLREPYFVGYELELLYPHVLTIDPKLKRPKGLYLRLNSLKLDAKAKTGKWVLDLTYESEIGTVSAFEIWEASWQGKHYLFSDAGLIFLRKKRFEWLRLKGKKRWLQKGASLRFTTLEFLRLTAFEELKEPIGDSRKAVASRKLLHTFLQFKAPTDPDLTGLTSDLRPYQKVGVQWLWFLHYYELAGLLCDEMGLGKTHQAMGLIAAIKNGIKGRKAKFLVVCPTSVIYHWENLINHFLPSVKPYLFHGVGRRFEAFSEDSYDVLLTSYGIVRTENKALSSFHFDLVIFDELQIAKNEKSLTHKALKNLSTTMRLGLTGTPIENRLMELKSLFDLVLPQYLPSTAGFRELFINPIEKYQDEEKRHLLSRLIHPFLLRRKKSEVLTELPEKIEELSLCDLSEEQRHLYASTVKQHRDPLLKELQDAATPPPLTHIFSLLSKLKQICNHPCLIHKDTHNYKKYHSGKWELFLELLQETRDSGQKLVIFSQYLGMLDIMGMHLKEKNIPFAEIRGSTKQRGQEVKRFAEDPQCEVFLGSLQAAGVGIDLTSASVVIHYDRWWNPAKENQATDRVHRMGQRRGVQVFKLITKDTIEEHIHNLIEQKLTLAKGVIGFDEHDQVKGLAREDLITLLQMLG